MGHPNSALHFLDALSARQAVVVGVFVGVSVLAGFIHWGILAHVSRLRTGDVFVRLFPFGIGFWSIAMLRRSWYPVDALPLRTRALVAYGISVVCGMVVFALLVAWVILDPAPVTRARTMLPPQ